MHRIDTASRVIPAPPGRIYAALTAADAVASWLPPAGMTGRIIAFEPREGGRFEMALTHESPAAAGKSGANVDIVRGSFVALKPDEAIVQRFRFESDDPAFAGVMAMAWTLEPVEGGTRVTVAAENVPAGIDHDVHETAMRSSLDNLARYLARTEIQRGA